MRGESWLYHLGEEAVYLSRICLDERALGKNLRISCAIAVHWAVPCCSIKLRMI